MDDDPYFDTVAWRLEPGIGPNLSRFAIEAKLGRHITLCNQIGQYEDGASQVSLGFYNYRGPDTNGEELRLQSVTIAHKVDAIAQPAPRLSQPTHSPVFLMAMPPHSTAYESTHGELLESPTAPYVDSYAAEYGIDLHLVLGGLFPAGIPTVHVDDPWSIGSDRPNATGNWTYYRSASTVLFDLLKLGSSTSSRGNDLVLVALYNVEAGQASGWRLAVVDGNYKIVVIHDLYAMSKTAEWDACGGERYGGNMINATLSVAEGVLVANVTYVVTGTGGFPHLGCSFTFGREDGPSILALQHVQRIQDGCEP